MTGCSFGEAQRLNEFCPTCGHVLMAHRQDRQCSACQMITAIDLLPGHRVLIEIPEDVGPDQARLVMTQLRDHFPGVDFSILADGARVVGVERAGPPPH